MEITETIGNLLSQVKMPVPEQGSDWLDPIKFLESQHREVEALFTEMENLGGKAYRAKEKVMEMIAEKLTLHTQLEEKFMYPAAKKINKDLVLESFEEHDAVKDLLRKLKRTAASDDNFDSRVKFLKELVEHHVKEEESDLFPQINSEMPPEEINAIGTKMQHAVTAGQRKVQQTSKSKKARTKTAKRKMH